MPFTRMDQLTAGMADIDVIGDALAKRQADMPEVIRGMLRQLASHRDGFPVVQLEHSLQTATRAERAGASEEMIVASLCHDIGKAVSEVNHAAISAEILRPFVSTETYEIIRTHQDFQGNTYMPLWERIRTLASDTRTGRGIDWRASSRTLGIKPLSTRITTAIRWSISAP